MTAWTDIEFLPTERPVWRKTETKQVKSTSEMIKEIISFQKCYNESGVSDDIGYDVKFVTEFVYYINRDEGVGTQEKADILGIINKVFNKVSVTKSEIKEILETRNIIEATLMLHQLTMDDRENRGLLDVMECVCKTHKILLKDLEGTLLTLPGKFSINERKTEYSGELHVYPKYNSEADAYDEVQRVIDRYNQLLNDITKQKEHDEYTYVLNIFKLSSVLLYKIVSAHPFGDANGRLCRLLCSYCLSVMTPFPSPIYNIYSSTNKNDYINAIKACRKSESNHPCDLVALIIESNWSSWKEFLKNARICQ